ncbi:MAG TPA: ABC transporter permease [Pyrinomonadaceae bacterium]|nr:ABC transporter permease [Pyrinomonadaceae bacterium]
MPGRVRLHLRALFRRAEMDLELDEELRFHLEKETEHNIARGMDPERARYAALRSFGGFAQVSQQCRETRGVGFIEVLLQDLRFAARTLRGSPGFSLVAVITLALGIGANTAIFSVVSHVLVRPLPYRDAERLVWVWGKNDQLGVSQGYLSNADIYDFGRQSEALESIAAWTTLPINLIKDGQSERLEGLLVTPNFFATLGVTMQAGRDFLPDEAQEGRNLVVIISDGLWRRGFGADPGVIGKRLTLDRYDANSFMVVGVAPAEVQYPQRTDVWMPDITEPGGSERGGHDLRAVARLKRDVRMEQAESELNTIAVRLEQQHPATNKGWRVSLTSVRDHVLGTPYKAVWMLLCAVGCVLLIACANVANLQFARAATRGKEIALRAALGASRPRIIRQLLTESMLLAFIGGGAGLLLAWWGVRLLRTLGPVTIPRLAEVGIDGSVLAFTSTITFLTGVAFGLLPALDASRPDLNETLKQGARGATASGRKRLRSLLLVSEVALTVLLLSGTGLLLKSFWRLRNVDPGFRAEHVLTAGISLNRDKYMQSDERRINFFRQVIERIEALPGVEKVGAISHLPFGGRGVNLGFTLEGRPLTPVEDTTRAELRVVSPAYFEAMGIPLRQGRAFTAQDTASASKVIIVNETFARRFLNGTLTLGKRLQIKLREPFVGEIVGVVGDVRHRGYDADPRPEVYVSYLQNTLWPVMNLVARTRSEPGEMAAAVQREILALDPTQAVFNVRPLTDFLADSIAERRFNLMLLMVFAAVALLTAAAGIYGVMAYTVARRMHEIGIRVALGAQKSDVLKLIIGQGMRLTLMGVAFGLICALALTRVLASLLYGVSATDPAAFACVVVLLVLVALLACYLPARKALGVDPIRALRSE